MPNHIFICDVCGGSGMTPNREGEPCIECDGVGEIILTDESDTERTSD